MLTIDTNAFVLINPVLHNVCLAGFAGAIQAVALNSALESIATHGLDSRYDANTCGISNRFSMIFGGPINPLSSSFLSRVEFKAN